MSKTIVINNKSYNTYATLTDAEDYFAAKFGSEWPPLGNVQKSQLLVSATRFIETKNYQGKPVEEEQVLKLPRIINEIQTNDELTLQACCELAETFYKNNGNADISNISSVSMGDSSISFRDSDKNESEADQLVENYLGGYMFGSVRAIL